jgi:hypothetical protein
MLTALLVLCAVRVVAAPPAFPLAKGGETLHVVSVDPAASPAERHAAEELASFLGQVTGADFAVVTPDEAGNRPQLAVGPGAVKALAPDFSLGGLGEDGILIRTLSAPRQPPHILLSGGPGAARGTLYAVYTFLEEQVGIRWWTRTESTIPDKPTLTLPGQLNVRYVPPVWQRSGYSQEGRDPDWAVRNKMNSGFVSMTDAARGGSIEYAGRNCHTFYLLVPPSKYFAEHPEWFAEVDGKRIPEGAQLCLTNPEVVKVAAASAAEWLRANPLAKMVAVDQNDYQIWCTCAACKAVDEAEGGPSGTNIRFANAVAAELEAEFPDVWIETFAYEYTRKPPKLTKPRDNVVVRLCSIECDFAHPLTHPSNKEFREDIEGWSKISKQLLIWDYVTNFYHYLQAHPNFTVIGPNIRFFRDHGVKGIYEQGNGQSLGSFGAPLKTWLIAKLLWNPDLNDAKLIEEFLAGYYGPAAPFLRAYYDLIHDEKVVGDFYMKIAAPPNAPYLAPSLLAKSAEIFEQARAAAAGRPEFLRRVEVAELGVLYSLLVNDFDDFFTKGSVPDPTRFLARLDRFEAIAAREQVTHIAEGGDLVPAWVKRVRGVVSGKSLPQTAWTAPLPGGEVAVLRLGAAWKFMSDPEKKGDTEAWYGEAFDDAKWAMNRTDLDRGWEKQGFPGYAGIGWYRHRFELPKIFDRKHLYVYFGAIDEEGWIHVNGEAKPAFEHSLETTRLMPAQIWNLPFSFEATGRLRPGQANLLAVKVNNAAYMGGIWRPVYVLASDAELSREDIAAALATEAPAQP